MDRAARTELDSAGGPPSAHRDCHPHGGFTRRVTPSSPASTETTVPPVIDGQEHGGQPTHSWTWSTKSGKHLDVASDT
ncbi:hypothetical protein GCM10029976_058750 [Kribbella albertanoniae]